MKEANFIRTYVRKFFEERIGEHGIVRKEPDVRGGEKWTNINPKPADLWVMWHRHDEDATYFLEVPVVRIPQPVPSGIVCFCTGFGLVEAKVIKGLTINIDGVYMRPAQKIALAKAHKCGHMALLAVRFEFKATKKEKKGSFHKYIEYSELERCGSISFNRDGTVK